MDIEHDNLLNASRYVTAKDLKKLYRAYNCLRKLAMSGNRAAMAVYLDLEAALEHSSLPERQRRYIQLHLIEGYTLFDVAEMECVVYIGGPFIPENQYEVTVVSDVVNSGLHKIKKILHSRGLFDGRRGRRISEEERPFLQG